MDFSRLVNHGPLAFGKYSLAARAKIVPALCPMMPNIIRVKHFQDYGMCLTSGVGLYLIKSNIDQLYIFEGIYT